MVETNQEPLQGQENTKKKKLSSQKSAVKSNEGDKPLVKKMPIKKDGKPAKAAGPSGAGRGQTVANMKKFLKGAWNELKKVHWPNRREIIAFTSVVLVAVTMIAVLIFAIDGILSRLLALVIR
ncbi:preprotein translocase subunit SecE [Phosphitispora fastidiosa]|uniref:preprotein translocase subunit SecE n=1 Tax=Phosphitispora fastidiosa TaxID=2837202 RepID=UPI001E3A16BB|nr:preprotein translocase subunit SecE [Phosphitispora fastidiosa]MBU7007477.1 preprotein translocase subunit SecE [Phosphitispora fastidiosa]